MAEIEVLTGPERRRRWSEAQKRAIVAAAFAPGAVVATTARRADVRASLIYRWRQELCAGTGGFAEVLIDPVVPGSEVGASRGTERAKPPGAADGAALELAIGDEVRLRIPPSIPPALAAAVVSALAVRR